MVLFLIYHKIDFKLHQIASGFGLKEENTNLASSFIYIPHCECCGSSFFLFFFVFA